MRRTASLKYYLKNPKKNGKLREVEVSIIYKFTAPGGRIEVPTGLWIRPIYWDRKAQEVKASHPAGSAFVLDFNKKLRDLKTEKLAQFEKVGDLTQFKALETNPPQAPEEKKSIAEPL